MTIHRGEKVNVKDCGANRLWSLLVVRVMTRTRYLSRYITTGFAATRCQQLEYIDPQSAFVSTM